MTRLLLMKLLLGCLLLVSCNKDKPIIPEDDGVPVTFSSAFTITETKAVTSVALPVRIDAFIVGSLTENDFEVLYKQGSTQSTGGLGTDSLYTNNVELAQKVSFINGVGMLPMMVKYPVNEDSIFVRAFAPTTFEYRMSTKNDSIVFENLDGQQDVLLTLPNIREMNAADGTYPFYGGGNNVEVSRSIDLIFYHKLSKVTFQFKAATQNNVAAWGKIKRLELVDYPNNITLLLKKGGVPPHEATKEELDYFVDSKKIEDIVVFDPGTPLELSLIAMPTDQPLYATAYVPPTEFGLTKTSLTLRITSVNDSGIKSSVVMTTPVDPKYLLLPGMHNNYIITLRSPDDKEPMAAMVTIAPWNNTDIGSISPEEIF